jgi:hypothetical protein
VGLFSYGSGLSSSMYSLHISSNAKPGSSLSRLIGNLSHVKPLLDQRSKVSPEEFAHTMEIFEQNHHKGKVIHRTFRIYTENGIIGDLIETLVSHYVTLATSTFSYTRDAECFAACNRSESESETSNRSSQCLSCYFIFLKWEHLTNSI